MGSWGCPPPLLGTFSYPMSFFYAICTLVFFLPWAWDGVSWFHAGMVRLVQFLPPGGFLSILLYAGPAVVLVFSLNFFPVFFLVFLPSVPSLFLAFFIVVVVVVHLSVSYSKPFLPLPLIF